MLKNIVSERESLVDRAADALVRTDYVMAELQDFYWREPGEGVFRADLSFINLMIGLSTRMERKYARSRGVDHWTQPGEILFIPDNVELYCNWTRGGGRVLSCWFDAKAICGRSGLDWEWPQFDLEATLSLKNPYISLAMRRIADELRAPSFTSDVQVEAALTFIMLELQRHLAGTAATPAASAGRLSQRQLTIVEDMVRDDSQGVTIARLAEACGCGARTLAAFYRSATGKTLRELIAGARIERAKALLMNEGALVKQVAYLSGFQTSAAFCAAFREATGHTPLQFRALNGAMTH